ncbi:metallophosphoesterase [Micromonospora inyonensis]|uniref:Calcineurin-like phosphoesterase n=1 Tax=Micromonospora inyonensis TaxID=47866 RepID=A0A1C6S4W2_9ACTN|nr:metallophosphoesterase [Micromonospora inyonensis]SCL24516.1 Calcineurin-like phosphoesterase [Micromonospora inyonensis]
MSRLRQMIGARIRRAAADDHDLVRLAAVRWLRPHELTRTGTRALLASIFGQYADKREAQQGAAFDQPVFRHDQGTGDFWFDYVADLGDGFDATYSVASLIASDLPLDTDGGVLPRGTALIMGGDQVYPYADATGYEQRTTRVYTAAYPCPPDGADGHRPWLYAVPGNHDWYDGLTAFLRVFGQQDQIGGWRTRQRRSYFALRLPHGWWLLAIDIQLDTYIDRPQLEYFRQVAAGIEPTASIIVCTAVPSWYQGTGTSTDRLAHFLSAGLGDRARQVRVFLTGDTHHYARYQRRSGDGPMLITAGIGGAYTAATHLLPERIAVSARLLDPDADKTAQIGYVRVGGTWPSPADSRREARRVLWRLPLRNVALLPVFATLYGLLGISGLTRSWLWSGALLAVAFAGCLAFARPRSGGRLRRLAFGTTLALVQVPPALAAVVGFATVVTDWRWPARAWAVAAVTVVGAVLAAVLLAAWLLAVSAWRVNENELFAAQAIEDYKGFLRLQVGTDGLLTVHPIGVRRSVRAWRPADGDAGPRLVPAGPGRLEPQLIEAPVRIPPTPGRPH